jgi:hypothetical protein
MLKVLHKNNEESFSILPNLDLGQRHVLYNSRAFAPIYNKYCKVKGLDIIPIKMFESNPLDYYKNIFNLDFSKHSNKYIPDFFSSFSSNGYEICLIYRNEVKHESYYSSISIDEEVLIDSQLKNINNSVLFKSLNQINTFKNDTKRLIHTNKIKDYYVRILNDLETCKSSTYEKYKVIKDKATFIIDKYKDNINSYIIDNYINYFVLLNDVKNYNWKINKYTNKINNVSKKIKELSTLDKTKYDKFYTFKLNKLSKKKEIYLNTVTLCEKKLLETYKNIERININNLLNIYNNKVKEIINDLNKINVDIERENNIVYNEIKNGSIINKLSCEKLIELQSINKNYLNELNLYNNKIAILIELLSYLDNNNMLINSSESIYKTVVNYTNIVKKVYNFYNEIEKNVNISIDIVAHEKNDFMVM